MDLDSGYPTNPMANPVFIPSVLNKILSYLPQSELKSFRNVSQQWAEEGWKIMRKNGAMQIQITNLARFEEIHHYFLSNKNNICTGIRFQDFSWIIVCSPIFLQFATEYGPLIKHVHLDESTYNADEPELQSKLFGVFSNLEELVLSFQEPDMSSFISTSRITVGMANDSDIDKYPFKLDNLKSLTLNRIFRKEDGRFVMKILKSAPKLQNISISKGLVNSDAIKTLLGSYNIFPRGGYLGEENEVFLVRPFQNFRILRRNANFATYNELFSHYFLNEEHLHLKNVWHLNFHMLIKSNSQLRSLKSRDCVALKTLHLVLIPNLNTHEIRSLLSSFSETLESLYLCLNAVDENDVSKTSQYNQIWDMSTEWKNLNLLCLRNIQTFSIQHTDTMPNLKTLLIHGCSFPNIMMKNTANEQESFGFDGSDDHHQNKLRTLAVHCDKNKRLTTSVLQSVGTRFPNLTKLKLDNLTDVGLRIIYSHLSLLEDLYLVSETFSDSGITGLRPEVCRKLLKTKENYNKSYSSISDLKRLCKLEVASSNISDVSILYGISECQCLRKLFLYSPKISSKSVRKIIDDMNLAALEIEFCQQLSDTVVQYAKKTFANPANIQINSQGPKSAIKMTEYFKDRGSTFHLRD